MPAPPAFADPATPNLPDFIVFLQASVQIPTSALPIDSPWPGYALIQAEAVVLNLPCGIPGIMRTLAVYNCATHLLLVIAPDATGSTYFAEARGNKGFSLNLPSSGLVKSATDQGTSSTLENPEWVKGLTVGQLGFMKTPWGREFLSFNQSYGSTIWGLS